MLKDTDYVMDEIVAGDGSGNVLEALDQISASSKVRKEIARTHVDCTFAHFKALCNEIESEPSRLTYGQQRMWEVVQSLPDITVLESGYSIHELTRLYNHRFDAELTIEQSQELLTGLEQVGLTPESLLGAHDVS